MSAAFPSRRRSRSLLRSWSASSLPSGSCASGRDRGRARFGLEGESARPCSQHSSSRWRRLPGSTAALAGNGNGAATITGVVRRLAAATSRRTRARTSRTSSSTTPTAAWSRTRRSTARLLDRRRRRRRDRRRDRQVGHDDARRSPARATNSPPTAILEVKTPACATWPDGLVGCDGRIARTTWTRSIVPSLGSGSSGSSAAGPTISPASTTSCPAARRTSTRSARSPTPSAARAAPIPTTTSSSWSIDFGDGTSASGDWATNPPTEVSHEYLIHHCPTCARAPATLTVTDSAGQSDSDAQLDRITSIPTDRLRLSVRAPVSRGNLGSPATHQRKEMREGGQYVAKTVPIRFSRGTAPQRASRRSSGGCRPS